MNALLLALLILFSLQALGTLYAVIALFLGLRQLGTLTLESAAAGPTPRVSIIVAAKDEASTLGQALVSLSKLDYPALEIIVVNDRSSDETGAVARQVAASSEGRIRVVDITTLPPGWLGKNHALAVGAAHAEGDWILFTDADIHFHPRALHIALTHAQAAHLDHLTLSPLLTCDGVWLRGMIGFFVMSLMLFTQPWKMSNPKSKHALGIGAFNLVRKTAYVDMAGHHSLKLRVDDDLQLGRAFKAAGKSGEMCNAPQLLSVAWYPNLSGLIAGLEKNVFAGLNYRTAWASFLCLAVPLLWWAPLGGVSLFWLAAAPLTLVAVASLVIALQAMLFLIASHGRISPWHALLAPCYAVLMGWITLRSMAVTLARGGVKWRDTFYPLAQLRAAHRLQPPHTPRAK